LAGDKACDIDPLDCDLPERYGIEMIAPHRGVRRSHDAGWSSFAPLPQT